MKRLIFVCLLFCASLAFAQADGPGGASSAGIPNKCGRPNCTVSGTLTIGKCIGPGVAFDNSATANQTLKNSAGTYVLNTTTDTATPIGLATNVIDSTHVCVAGSGSWATVQVDSGGATSGHYALQSTTTSGKVKDSGAATVPTSGCWLGVFAGNASASSNGTVIVNPGCVGSSTSRFVQTPTSDQLTGAGTFATTDTHATAGSLTAGSVLKIMAGGTFFTGTSGSSSLAYRIVLFDGTHTINVTQAAGASVTTGITAPWAYGIRVYCQAASKIYITMDTATLPTSATGAGVQQIGSTGNGQQTFDCTQNVTISIAETGSMAATGNTTNLQTLEVSFP